VKRGTTSVGIKAKDGVALLVDKRISSRLLEPQSTEKIFQVDDHIGAVTSGLVADARALIDRARVDAQINRVVYNEPIGIETLAKKIADHKQTFTQYGGVRPYGTALLIGGIDDSGPRLFETDPSGALLMVKATGIGSGRNAVMEFLEEKYNEDVDIGNAIRLGLEALYKATEGKLTVDTIEIAAINAKDNRFQKLGTDELEAYVKSVLDSMPKE
jgi:proteasome alpha subunit